MKLKVKKSYIMEGTILVSGSKNACLPEMVVSLLTKEKVILYNVPSILDVYSMIDILKKINVKVDYNEETKTLTLQRRKIKKNSTGHEISKIRASYYLMGALFSIKKNFVTKYPGGCNFVNRPINYHLDALKKMGASIKQKNNKIIIKRKRKLPCIINLETKSLGTTINIIFASVLTKGETIINNASIEPEVIDVINLLNKMNASITIINDQIIIKGIKKLKGTTHYVIPDRMEAGSYMFLASSLKGSNVLLKNINLNHLEYVINFLKKQGLIIIEKKDELRIINSNLSNSTNIIADNYPLFPTDLQQIACSYLLTCEGLSVVKDNIYPKRFSEVLELLNMNANMYILDNVLLIMKSNLIGKTVFAKDLRAGFSLIIAGAIAEGETIIENAEVILRGYENVVQKLKNCNINIEAMK